MAEWIRFWIVAVLLICGIVSFVLAATGVFKFGFVMNRMHSSGIGDSLGLMCVVLAMIIASGLNLASLKLFLLILFMWLTSPVSTHFLSRIEMNTNPFIRRHVRFAYGSEDRAGPEQDCSDGSGSRREYRKEFHVGESKKPGNMIPGKQMEEKAWN